MIELYRTEGQRVAAVADVNAKIAEINAFKESFSNEVRPKIINANDADLGALATSLEAIRASFEGLLDSLQNLSNLVHDKISQQA